MVHVSSGGALAIDRCPSIVATSGCSAGGEGGSASGRSRSTSQLEYPGQVRPVEVHLMQAGAVPSHLTRRI